VTLCVSTLCDSVRKSKKQILDFLILIFFLFGFITPVISQEMTVEEYIAKYSDLAVREMKKYHIPASITLAQGILESGSGNSSLAVKANNHFGVKCHKGWTGKTFHMDDDARHECFRKYASVEDSYRDHSEFLATRDRYDFLFLLDITDYKAWAVGLKKAGYATNPLYPDLLIRIIEENELYRFDRGGEAMSKKTEDRSQKTEARSQKTEAAVEENLVIAPLEKILFGKGGDSREIFLNNKVKFILARKGDTWNSIAQEFGIYGWQVRKYNELTKKDEIVPGEIIYLERKRNRGAVEGHTVKNGETMRNISQRYAVKESMLYRNNDMKKSDRLKEGDYVLLK